MHTILWTLTFSLMAGQLAAQTADGMPLGAMPPTATYRDRAILAGSVHSALATAVPLGPCDPDLPMQRMILSFKMRPEARKALDQLLVEQQDPFSPSYHQWLTPEQFATAFGPKADEIARLSAWLMDQGFTIDDIARGGMSLTFSGKVRDVVQAFLTPVLNYRIQDQVYHANSIDPSFPACLADLVDGIVSLHNIPIGPLPAPGNGLVPSPQYTAISGNHFLSPEDFATIYNIWPLYNLGYDGSGVEIAIVGATNPTQAMPYWNAFRALLGLPANPPRITINGADPGDQPATDGEVNLDVEWSGAVAPNATINYVCSMNTQSTAGVLLSAQYIVNENAASVISMSYSTCEAFIGFPMASFVNKLWSQAAAQGITAVVSSGDDGPSGCYPQGPGLAKVRSVNGFASTPYNVAIGGTEFHEGGAIYWSTSNLGQSFRSALGYIPEVVWNESGATGGAHLMASGGGPSMLYPKPAWQVAPGVPNDGWRDLPDLALTSAGHDAYMVEGEGGISYWYGTSCATPAFAGLLALLIQKTGQRQGNVNPILYTLKRNQALGGPTIFHEITSGDNSVPGDQGYSAGPGYNMATGLGSVDATALVENWSSAGARISVPVRTVGVLAGKSTPFTATVSGSADPTVIWSSTPGGTLTPGPSASGATFYAATAGTYTLTATPAADLQDSVTIEVVAHTPGPTSSGPSVSGLDVLDLVGSYGTTDPSEDCNGDGVVNHADLELLLQLLGW